MARLRAFRSVAIPESIDGVLPFLRQLQDAVGDSIGMLTDVPLLDFVYKRDVVLLAGTTQIAHGMQRAWRGYIVTRKNASVVIHDPDDQPLKERLLTLSTTGNVVVDLFMF